MNLTIHYILIYINEIITSIIFITKHQSIPRPLQVSFHLDQQFFPKNKPLQYSNLLTK